jgi:hypothetical protein
MMMKIRSDGSDVTYLFLIDANLLVFCAISKCRIKTQHHGVCWLQVCVSY